MYLYLLKSIILLLAFATLSAGPVSAQKSNGNTSSSKKNQHFIQKGQILTSFSFGFTNASHSEYNQDFAREITDVSLHLNGLYFVTNHVGVGPMLEYQFTYHDFVPYYQNQADTDTRRGRLSFGILGGYYVPASAILGGSSNINLFVNGGFGFLRENNRTENTTFNRKPDYEFMYQLGIGALFPVGKHIAIQTKLNYQAYRKNITIYNYDSANEHLQVTGTTHKWPNQLELSVGLDVTF